MKLCTGSEQVKMGGCGSDRDSHQKIWIRKRKFCEKGYFCRWKMKISRLHINFILLILGIFSLQSVEFDSPSNVRLLLETEIEESIDNINEFDIGSDKSDSDSDGGKNAALPSEHILLRNPFSAKSNLVRLESKYLSQKPHLFILYCCLKLDC